MKISFPKHDLDVGIGIANSIFELALIVFWKRALLIFHQVECSSCCPEWRAFLCVFCCVCGCVFLMHPLHITPRIGFEPTILPLQV